MLGLLVGYWAFPARGQSNPAGQDITLQVGIIQRFGEESSDRITLKATDGGFLSLEFAAPDGKIQALQTSRVDLEIAMRPLPQAELRERVVLGEHRSFESAENSAREWRSRGVEVELAKPKNWQVWAKRDTYETPLLRHLLLKSLREKGRDARLESETLREKPMPSWVLDNFRYNREYLNVISSTGVIEAIENPENEGEEGYFFAGPMRLQPNAYGDYTLVNFVPLETYLRGVVPFEIGSWAPFAALEAQAIIARTYALRNLRRFAIDGYQLCADTHCQVYKGLDGATTETDAAIASTRSLVLVYENELVDALYHSTSGGVTAPFSDIWAGEDRPYLKAVVDSAENIWDLQNNSLADENNLRRFLGLKEGFNGSGWEVFRWQEENTLEEIAAFLQRYLRSQKQSPRGF